jgi:hypothetical protein
MPMESKVNDDDDEKQRNDNDDEKQGECVAGEV